MCITQLLSRTALFRVIKKSGANLKGISQSFFFLALILATSSLAVTGYSKNFSLHKLTAAFKAAVGLQTIGLIIGCAWLIVDLVSTSIPPFENVFKRFRRVASIIITFTVLQLFAIGLIVYSMTRTVVRKTADSSDETNDPEYGLWNGLLTAGTTFIGFSFMITITFGNENENENENNYNKALVGKV